MTVAADILILIVAIAYLAIGLGYPSYARVVPTIVGAVAVIVAGVQLLLALFRPAKSTGIASKRIPEHAGTVGEPDDLPMPANGPQWQREIGVIVWSVVFMVAIVLLGFVIAVPAFFFSYFVVNRPRRWLLAVVSAVVMWAITVGVFERLLGLSLPGGFWSGG